MKCLQTTNFIAYLSYRIKKTVSNDIQKYQILTVLNIGRIIR